MREGTVGHQGKEPREVSRLLVIWILVFWEVGRGGKGVFDDDETGANERALAEGVF